MPSEEASRAREAMQPLLERFHEIAGDTPAIVTVELLKQLDPWFLALGLPKSATESYGPNGWRPVLGVWRSLSELRWTLYDNMGGGVPIELLQVLLVLAHDEWSGTP
jgi:hypothetical protein